MPTYEYACDACGDFEKIMRMSEYQREQDCPECGKAARRVIRTPVNFNLPGDSWASKNGRIAKQMARKNRRLKKITDEQKRDQPMVSLAPNVDGERTSSWSEAQRLAVSKGKDGGSYDKMVRKEKSAGKKSEVTT
jgi:putative FmdB family regulatory protein